MRSVLATTLLGSLTVFVAVPYRSTQADTVNVATEYGIIRGIRSGNVASFLGIPFAKPPVGDLRWKAPLPPDNVTSLDAFEFKPECPQVRFNQGSDVGAYVGSENCLYLNIWAPVGANGRPVMVFIHGGGNQQGSASQETDGVRMYDGRYLAAHENVVVVTLQYRLGPLGFLVHPGLAAEDQRGRSGNYGLLDQVLALSWVKRNITPFGGDTSRILVFGESAGAVDVANLLVSPLAAGLFSRALIQSGAAVAGDYEKAAAYGISFVNDTLHCAGSSDAEKIACARGLPVESLLVTTKSPLSAGVVASQWGPVIDGAVIPDAPLRAIQESRFHRMAVVVGSNADEMAIAAPTVVTPGMVEALVRSSLPPAYVDEALTLYPPGVSNAEAKQSYIGITTDAQFTVSARRIARTLASSGASVYRYFFSHTMSGLFGALGAFHGIELFYAFRTLPFTASYGRAGRMTRNDSLVMNMTSRYWARFAATGDPNDSTLAAWPLYSVADDPYLEIKPTAAQGYGVRTKECDFWDKVLDSMRAGIQPVRPGYYAPAVVKPVVVVLCRCQPDDRGMRQPLWTVFDIRGRRCSAGRLARVGGYLPARSTGVYLARLNH